MKDLGRVLPKLAMGVVAILPGCPSPPSTDQLVLRARTTVEHQESEAITLVRALASAQREAATASFDFILNAAAQNFRTGKGMPLDSPLSDEDHARVLETAHKNMQEILDH